ncbi:MAG: hypothetical protein GVY29_08990 [Spirochaetes bacterium]|nr:hypothetical protein [Spirochaetota bacterium]
MASLKQTGALSLLGDYSFDEKTVNIHPNDAYDLGLMTLRETVKIFVDTTVEEFLHGSGQHTFGNLYLRNETRIGTLEVSLKTAKRLGRPKQVRLLYFTGEDTYGRILIQSVDSAK